MAVSTLDYSSEDEGWETDTGTTTDIDECEQDLLYESDSDSDLDHPPITEGPVPIDPSAVLAEGSEFTSSALGITSINTFAWDHGYAVSTLRSKPSKKGVMKTVALCCDRGRVYRDRVGSRIRHTTTLAIGCPFRITLRRDFTRDVWVLTHENTTHNHHSSLPSTHVAHRNAELQAKGEFST